MNIDVDHFFFSHVMTQFFCFSSVTKMLEYNSQNSNRTSVSKNICTNRVEIEIWLKKFLIYLKIIETSSIFFLKLK